MVKISDRDINKLYSIIMSDKSDKRQATLIAEYILLNKIDVMDYEMSTFTVKLNEKYKVIMSYCRLYRSAKHFNKYIFSDTKLLAYVKEYMNIYDAIVGGKSDISIACNLASLDVSSKKFKDSFFSLYLLSGYDDRLSLYSGYLSQYSFILDKIKEYEKRGLIEEGKKLNNENNIDFLRAKIIVLDYLNCSSVISLDDFLISNNLSNVLFSNYISLVKKYDRELYDAFIKEVKFNESIILKSNIDIVRDLYNGINNGTMTPLEFIKRFPYCMQKNCNAFLISLRFIRENTPECYDTILKYCLNNDLVSNDYGIEFELFNVNEFYRTTVIIDGYELTDSDKDNIINYMNENNIPLLKKFYFVVRNAYLDGEIDCKRKKRLNILGDGYSEK